MRDRLAVLTGLARALVLGPRLQRGLAAGSALLLAALGVTLLATGVRGFWARS